MYKRVTNEIKAGCCYEEGSLDQCLPTRVPGSLVVLQKAPRCLANKSTHLNQKIVLGKHYRILYPTLHQAFFEVGMGEWVPQEWDIVQCE